MNSHPTARRGLLQAFAALFVVAASVAPAPLAPTQTAQTDLAANAPLHALVTADCPSGQPEAAPAACPALTVQVDEPSGGSQAPSSAASPVEAGAAASPDAPLAPGLGTTIEGIDFDENDTNSGNYSIPPDPHGAAGPDHVVSVVNTSIEWHTKAGAQEMSEALSDTFASLVPLTRTFDPKVIYDQYNDRFVVVTLEKTDTVQGAIANTSRIFVGVSDDDDPNGAWYIRAIDSKISISGSDTWADYPGLAIDGEAVYIVNNMFTFGVSPSNLGQRLWILPTASWYADGVLTPTVHSPATASGAPAATMQPAHMFGTAPGGVGTFLTLLSGLTNGTDEFLGVIRVDHPLTTPVFSYQAVNLGNIDAGSPATLPDAPQPMTTTLIEVNDRRALNAVWRDDALWVSGSIMPASGSDTGEVTAHWIKIDTSTLAALSVADQGNAGGDDIDTGAYTYFPSVMVDQDGNMGIGFALSGPSTFAGAYYTSRKAGDAAGTTEATGTLAAGVTKYERRFGGSRNRWGDYSGMSLDPADDTTFWLYNQYALITGTVLFGYPGENGRWGTRWGSFGYKQVPDVAIVSDAPDPSTPGQIISITVTVTGTLGVPTGLITVTASSGQGTCSSILLDGSAICDITPTVPGTHTLIAAYSGDADYASGSSAPASHTVQAPITGLAATNSSPDGLGQTTLFTATVISGTSVAYAWNFGDGGTGSGATTNHVYSLAGFYTAVVTATNGVSGPITATTAVTITNSAPTADAGADQNVIVGSLVTLDGSGSTDPESSPLSFYWSQTGGPAVVLSSSTLSMPTFSAPANPTVITFTLVVTDTGGLADATPDEIVVTVDDEAIAGLLASNNSPKAPGEVVDLNATLFAGTNVSYEWAFGDGGTEAGATITHTYAATGTYTAIVTATNSSSIVTATTTVEITSVFKLHLPVVQNIAAAAHSGPAGYAAPVREAHRAGVPRLRPARR